MLSPRFVLAFAVALWMCSSAFAGAAQNLLDNGGFEKGGASPVVGWSQVYPPGIQKPAPTFARVEMKSGALGAKEGEAFGRIQTQKAGGFSSFTQRGSIKSGQNLLNLSAWVRVDEIESRSAVYLIVLFIDGDGKQIGMEQSRRLTEKGEWQFLEKELVVPEGCEEWMMRCGIQGKASACFDDVQLIPAKLKGDVVPVQLAVHHGDYVIRTAGSKKGAWVSMSIPFPFAKQMPLAIRVTSDPPQMVKELKVLEDRENRPLRVVMKKMDAGTEVKLRVETLTMVADRPTSEGNEIELANPKKLPKDVKQHLKAAPGVDIKDKNIRAAAAGFSRDDFASMMKDVQEYLRENLKYKAGNSQGAVECLERGEAVCTGFANVAASVLIAADVPTRILACTQLTGRLQEHYVVEAWTPDLGWSRMESTGAIFPWRDSNNLIVRVVYPDAWRNQGDVPIYIDVSSGASGGLSMDPSDGCWQGADQLASAIIPLSGFESITKAADKAFRALTKKAANGAVVRFVPEASAAKKLKLDKRGLEVLTAVDNWLAN